MRTGSVLRDLKQNPLVVAAMVLSIGVIAALAGPWNRVASRGTTTMSSQPKALSVLAASHALPAGSEIGPKDFTIREVSGSVPAGAASSQADIVGRITAKPYAAREVFLRDSLRDASTLGIAGHVRPGQRAFSIRIAEDDIV